MNDRRKETRHAVRLLVRHQADGEVSPVVDYASDLSHSGLFIQTDRAVRPDDTLHVEFAPLRDARLVVAFCRVARVSARGIGAEFLRLDDESKDALSTALAAAEVPLLGGGAMAALQARV